MPFTEEEKRCVEKIEKRLELAGGTVSLDEFRALCATVFGPREVEENGHRIDNIFAAFDLNGDGVLDEQEWQRCYEKWLRAIVDPVNVLLIVDVQNDFIGGSLPIKGYGGSGEAVIDPINRLLKEVPWHRVVYSLDWHPDNHISFFENLHARELHPDSKVTKEQAKPFDTVTFSQPRLEQTLWPKHCVMGTWGAQLHERLLIVPNSEQVRKGKHPDREAYSAFSDDNAEGSSELEEILSRVGATNVFVCGLAYDVCVKSTCLDGLRLGYPVAVVERCCGGIDPNDVADAKELILANGGLAVDHDTVIALVKHGKRDPIMAQQAAKRLGVIEAK